MTIDKQYQRRGVDLEDVVQSGILGLIRAAESFDPCEEARFGTYAAYWIKQSIRLDLPAYRPIRLPHGMCSLLAKLQALGTSRPVASCDVASDDGDDLADVRAMSPYDSLCGPEDLEPLPARLDILDDRERMVIALRFGLDGQEALTLREIGERLGITREGVRQIEVKTLAKLRA